MSEGEPKPQPGGELELTILQALWDRSRPVTVREIHAQVGTPRGIVYTTVAEVLDRLVDKGLVTRRRRGRAFEFEARVDASETRRVMAREFIERLTRGGPRPAIAALVGALDDIYANHDNDDVGSAGLTLAVEIPVLDRNQGGVARARARLQQVEAEYEARLIEARSQVGALLDRLAAVEGARAEARGAELAERAAAGGAMSPLAARELRRRADAAALRAEELEQSYAALRIGVEAAAGVTR